LLVGSVPLTYVTGILKYPEAFVTAPVIVNILFTVPLSLDDNITLPLLFGVLLSSQVLNHAN